MLFLIFELDGERYGVEAKQVVEVTPFVELKALTQGPTYLLGIMNYRGQATPVIDLQCMVKGKPCPQHYSSRIMIVDYPYRESHRRLALLTPRLTQSEVADGPGDKLDVQLNDAPYLGQVNVKASDMTHRLRLDRLLSPEVCEELFG